ncbi:MAG: tetratricopeptide repeat protein, partial [Chloroflexota bacterium]
EAPISEDKQEIENGAMTGLPNLHHIIQQVTTDSPWLLLLDDLHWADPHTLQFLAFLAHYLVEHTGEARLMIVATYRQDQLTTNDSLRTFVNNLGQNPAVSSLTLSSLSRAEVSQLLENLWSQKAPPDLVTAIFRRTKGNVLFVEEVAKSLIDDNIVTWRDSKWHFAPVVETSLPQDIGEAVLRRVNRLSRETQTVLNQMATLGSTFHFEDLYEMINFSHWNALESLDILLIRQFVTESPAEKVLRFKHSDMQQVLYQNLSPLKRKLMHREAADILEDRFATPEGEALTGTLAYHFYQSGEIKKWLFYSFQSARKAQNLYAIQTALDWYDQALDALDQLDRPDEYTGQRFDILLARVGLYHRQGNREAQATDLITLQRLAQRMEDPAKQAIAHNYQAMYERAKGQFALALTEAQASLIASRETSQPALEIESLLQLAKISLAQGHFEAARTHVDAADKILASHKGTPLEAEALILLARIYQQFNEYEQAEFYYRQALEINQAHHHWVGQAKALIYLGQLYLEMGIYGPAQSVAQQALDINRMLGYQLEMVRCEHLLALIDNALGLSAQAQQTLQKLLSRRRHLEDRVGEAEAFQALGRTYLAQGKLDAAQSHLLEALEIFELLNLRYQTGQTLFVSGLALEAMAEWSQAEQAYQSAYDIQREVGLAVDQLDAQAGLARCHLAAGQLEVAQSEIAPSIAWLNDNGAAGLIEPIRLYLTIAQIQRANQDSEGAATTLAAGQALLQERTTTLGDVKQIDSYLNQVRLHKRLLDEVAPDEVEEVG